MWNKYAYCLTDSTTSARTVFPCSFPQIPRCIPPIRYNPIQIPHINTNRSHFNNTAKASPPLSNQKDQQQSTRNTTPQKTWIKILQTIPTTQPELSKQTIAYGWNLSLNHVPLERVKDIAKANSLQHLTSDLLTNLIPFACTGCTAEKKQRKLPTISQTKYINSSARL